MDFVTYEKEGYIGVITIDRPEALNALNGQVLQELREVLAAAEEEAVPPHLRMAEGKELRCLLITGAGKKAFAAGADIGEMCGLTQTEGLCLGALGNGIFLQIENFPVPVIAVVNGFALGGGCELAMSCDIRICSDNARFGQPESALGITPGFGGTQRLPRIVGAGKAKELLFTARMIDAKEAERIGLVEHIYPQEQLLEKGKELAVQIAGNAPIAVRNCKAAVNQGIHEEMEKAVELETQFFGSCFGTEDQQAAMKGFLEKQSDIVFLNR